MARSRQTRLSHSDLNPLPSISSYPRSPCPLYPLSPFASDLASPCEGLLGPCDPMMPLIGSPGDPYQTLVSFAGCTRETKFFYLSARFLRFTAEYFHYNRYLMVVYADLFYEEEKMALKFSILLLKPGFQN